MLASDGTLHYSDLRQFSRSAAHYKHRIQETYEATRAMRVGTCVHHLVLGERQDRPLVVFPGERRQGNAWEAFKHNNQGVEIVTQPEMDDAKPVAMAVLANPFAKELMAGAELEVPLKWEMRGVPCSTGGVDILGKSYVVELKTTSCAEPDAFEKHSFKMLYQAQLAWYRAGLAELSRQVDEAFIVAAETEPPYPVTVFKLSAELLEDGAKSIALWLERYIQCRDAGEWPAYAQSIVTMNAPAWARDEES